MSEEGARETPEIRRLPDAGPEEMIASANLHNKGKLATKRKSAQGVEDMISSSKTTVDGDTQEANATADQVESYFHKRVRENKDRSK